MESALSFEETEFMRERNYTFSTNVHGDEIVMKPGGPWFNSAGDEGRQLQRLFDHIISARACHDPACRLCGSHQIGATMNGTAIRAARNILTARATGNPSKIDRACSGLLASTYSGAGHFMPDGSQEVDIAKVVAAWVTKAS